MPLRLSEYDLKFLVETVADRRKDHEHVINLVRDKDDLLEPMLEDPRLMERLFHDEEALLNISSFMLFTILLRHIRGEIKEEAYLYDYEIGARKQRIPVFVVSEVTNLLEEHEALNYLAEMLASFNHTRSIVLTWKDSRGRSREDSFNDMDIDDMIQLCQQIEPASRPLYYRRIGDIALFLSGIYPDHAIFYHFLTPRSSRRVSHGRSLQDYEREGQTFYQKAAEHTPQSRRRSVLTTLSENFANARRALNVLSERYLRDTKRNLYLGSQGAAP